MKNLLFIVFVFFSFNYSQAQDFVPFQNILNKYLIETNLPNGGLKTAFEYEKAIQDPDVGKWIQQQIEILNKIEIKSLNSKDKANAFWINTYNFYMVHIILQKGFESGKLKISSVKDLGNFFNPYRIFKSEINLVAGKKMSLDQIEKETLLGPEYAKKGWKDARIHFAVNCASVGCPPLRKEIYQAATLDKTLNENIKKAFKTPIHLKMDGKILYLTHLFKWYEDDFKQHSGGIKKFIYQFVDEGLKKEIQETKEIEFINYSWKLNRPANF